MTPLGFGIFGLVFLAVALALFGAQSLLSRRDLALRGRLEGLTHGGPVPTSEVAGRASSGGTVLRALSALAKPREGSEELSQIQLRLSYAGLRGAHVTEALFATKLVLAVALGGTVLALATLRANPLQQAQLLALIATTLGFYAPNVWLHRRVKEVQRELAQALPDVLDLLTTCVEAGLGIEAALQRISQELGLVAPRLARELELTLAEVHVGVSRSNAFRRLADRTGVEDLRALSAVLVQTEMFGTSIAGALRVHSKSLRLRRTHLAEEKAATVGVKLVLPLIVFLIPSLFGVILGPAVVRIMETMMPTLGGGS